jgi:hypothetical protein
MLQVAGWALNVGGCRLNVGYYSISQIHRPSFMSAASREASASGGVKTEMMVFE